MCAVLPCLMNVLDAIRGTDVTASRGYGIWAPDGAAPRRSWPEALLNISDDRARVAGWRKALETAPAAAAAFDIGYAKLRSLAGLLPGARHLIHGDLLNRNVLVRGSPVSAVLDWGNAMYGYWLYDAAWLIYWWPLRHRGIRLVSSGSWLVLLSL